MKTKKVKILIISVLVIILVIISILIIIRKTKSSQEIRPEGNENGNTINEIWRSIKVEMYDDNELSYSLPSDLVKLKIDNQEIEICLNDGTEICNKVKYEIKDNKYLVNYIESMSLQNAEFEKSKDNELILNGTLSETQNVKYYFYLTNE